MKTSDFLNEVTVESLNKELYSKFGKTVNISKYSKEQLEDYSKAIGAKLTTFKTKSNFNESLTNTEYQKAVLIQKIVEAAINQYIETPIEEDDIEADIEDVSEDDTDVTKDFNMSPDFDGPQDNTDDNAKDVLKKSSQIMAALKGITDDPKSAQDARMAILRIMQGRALNPVQIKAFGSVLQKMMLPFLEKGQAGMTRLKAPIKSVGGDLSKEAVGESVVTEGAEDTAAVIMAAKDMVDRFTSFLEDVAEMGAEGMLELADSIRDELGQEQSEQFVGIVKPALESAQEVLTTSREALTQGVGVLTGEGAPTDTIGAEPEGDVAPEVDAEEPIDAEPTDDEFGASDAAAGGTEPVGREKREGYQPVKKPIAESTRIFRKLAK